MLIHFPIGLFITGVALDLVSRGKRASPLATAAYLNLSIAAAAIFPVVGTGLLAWQLALAGKTLKGLPAVACDGSLDRNPAGPCVLERT